MAKKQIKAAIQPSPDFRSDREEMGKEKKRKKLKLNKQIIKVRGHWKRQKTDIERKRSLR